MVRHEDHSWFVLQLPARRLDALEQDEKDHFDAHRQSCAKCREIWNDYANLDTEDWSTITHIPSVVLGRWDGRGPKLDRVLSDSVAAHLQDCETCQGTLELLQQRKTSDANSPSTLKRWFATWHSRDLLLASWAVAASITCVIVLSNRETDRSAVGLIPSVQSERSARAVETGSENTLRINPTVDRLAVRIPVAPEFRGLSRAILEVSNAAGALVLRADVPAHELAQDEVTVVLARPGRFDAGRYHVAVIDPTGRVMRDDTYFVLSTAP